MGALSSGENNYQVLILGLQGSGKTTLLKKCFDYYYQKNEEIHDNSTEAFNMISLKLNSNSIDIWELGGNNMSKSLWKAYYRALNVSLVIFVVDVRDPDSMMDALREFLVVVNEEQLKRADFLVLFNCFLERYEILDLDNNKYKNNIDEFRSELENMPIYRYEDRVSFLTKDLVKDSFTEQVMLDCFAALFKGKER